VAKKVLVGDQSGTTGEMKGDPYTASEGIEDPDGNAIYTVGNPPPAGAPPVSGLKGATVVASGSVALGGGGAVSVNIEAGTALRYYLFGVYWAGGNNVAFSASIGARIGFSTLYFPALGVAVTAGYKVYRVNET